ncbi:MAG: hypothetical protein CVU87_05550 [Firmicutes bacterium HGW-Firmicutes-12]|jgi:hypothetical protein|nr:MAG: hypothetical protein CVU87_05550 [Firmicutes bacterium HGW-Firmicutes-12]
MRRDFIGGLFLILLGSIFILNNFGYIGWDYWQVFLEFWPLFLIAIGLRLIFRNNIFIQILALLLILIIPLVYYVGYGNNTKYRRSPFPRHFETQKGDALTDNSCLDYKL